MKKYVVAGFASIFAIAPAWAQLQDSTIVRPSPSFKNLPNGSTNTAFPAAPIGQRITVPAGQRLVARFIGERLYISSGEKVPAELVLIQPLVSDDGVTLIAPGAILRGEFIPTTGGSRFLASQLITRGVTVSLGAESSVIHDVKDPRETNAGAIVGDAAIGAAGSAILSAITGDRTVATEELLAGVAAGIAIGNVTAPQVVIIDKDAVLDLTTTRGLTFGQR